MIPVTESEAERLNLDKFLPKEVYEGVICKLPIDLAVLLSRAWPYQPYYKEEEEGYIRRKIRYFPREDKAVRFGLHLEAKMKTLDVVKSNMEALMRRVRQESYRMDEEVIEALNVVEKQLTELYRTLFNELTPDAYYVMRIE